MINVARNLGGSILIAMTQTVFQQQEQVNNSSLIVHVNPTHPQYQETLRQVTQYFIDHGASAAEASGQAIAWIGQEIIPSATIGDSFDDDSHERAAVIL